jgi:hypothetical protein
LRAFSETGEDVSPLGLNLEDTKAALRESFVPSKFTGAAFVSRPKGLSFLGNADRALPILAFLRQSLIQEGGRWSERGLSLKIFAVPPGAEPFELDGRQRATFVRCIQHSTRKNDPSGIDVNSNLTEVEGDLLNKLRIPTDDEIATNIRHAVWPIAAIILVP